MFSWSWKRTLSADVSEIPSVLFCDLQAHLFWCDVYFRSVTWSSRPPPDGEGEPLITSLEMSLRFNQAWEDRRGLDGPSEEVQTFYFPPPAVPHSLISSALLLKKKKKTQHLGIIQVILLFKTNQGHFACRGKENMSRFVLFNETPNAVI